MTLPLEVQPKLLEGLQQLVEAAGGLDCQTADDSYHQGTQRRAILAALALDVEPVHFLPDGYDDKYLDGLVRLCNLIVERAQAQREAYLKAHSQSDESMLEEMLGQLEHPSLRTTIEQLQDPINAFIAALKRAPLPHPFRVGDGYSRFELRLQGKDFPCVVLVVDDTEIITIDIANQNGPETIELKPDEATVSIDGKGENSIDL